MAIYYALIQPTVTYVGSGANYFFELLYKPILSLYYQLRFDSISGKQYTYTLGREVIFFEHFAQAKAAAEKNYADYHSAVIAFHTEEGNISCINEIHEIIERNDKLENQPHWEVSGLTITENGTIQELTTLFNKSDCYFESQPTDFTFLDIISIENLSENEIKNPIIGSDDAITFQENLNPIIEISPLNVQIDGINIYDFNSELFMPTEIININEILIDDNSISLVNQFLDFDLNNTSEIIVINHEDIPPVIVSPIPEPSQSTIKITYILHFVPDTEANAL